MTQKPKILLAAIAVGWKYKSFYMSLFQSSHENYAKRYDYDFVLIDYLISDSATSPSQASLQKLLLPSLPGANTYDWILYVDLDILIRHWATPDVRDLELDPNVVYMVDEYTQPSPKRRLEINSQFGFPLTPADYYRRAGFNVDAHWVLNGGMMIFNPRAHGELLRHIYHLGEQAALGHPLKMHYEQSLVGSELQKAGIVDTLPTPWNFIYELWLDESEPAYSEPFKSHLSAFAKENYLIHFAGKGWKSRLPDIATARWRW